MITSLAVITPAAAILFLPIPIAANAGAAMPLSVVVAFAVVLVIMNAVYRFTQRISHAGSFFAFVRAARRFPGRRGILGGETADGRHGIHPAIHADAGASAVSRSSRNAATSRGVGQDAFRPLGLGSTHTGTPPIVSACGPMTARGRLNAVR